MKNRLRPLSKYTAQLSFAGQSKWKSSRAQWFINIFNSRACGDLIRIFFNFFFSLRSRIHRIVCCVQAMNLEVECQRLPLDFCAPGVHCLSSRLRYIWLNVFRCKDLKECWRRGDDEVERINVISGGRFLNDGCASRRNKPVAHLSWV